MDKKFFKRLIAQAEEARELGLNKLAEDLDSVLSKTDVEFDEKLKNALEREQKEMDKKIDMAFKPFTDESLKRRAREAIWDVAFAVFHHYKLPGVDSGKLAAFVDEWGDMLLEQVKEALPALSAEFPYKEEPLPGQSVIRRKKK